MVSESSPEFIWNDGGRATAGFVGLAGDCVTRAIAIGTGLAYRDVYQTLGELTGTSVRNGVYIECVEAYLKRLSWEKYEAPNVAFHQFQFPTGPAIFSISAGKRRHHLCTVIDGTVHDTWNPIEDEEYFVQQFWTPPPMPAQPDASAQAGLHLKNSRTAATTRTQKEFDKILRRLRALDRTANNSGSTEGEKRNAIRMIQSLMLQHNLSREDLVDSETNSIAGFMRQACPVNGKRAAAWEKQLAFFVTSEIFPMVQWYTARRSHRTYFWFYGPVDDVQNTLVLFRELLVTIASAAQLRYGSYLRGSGASYAEGYVAGLPRSSSEDLEKQDGVDSQNHQLIRSRMLSTRRAATNWLRDECCVQLVSSGGSGRNDIDAAANSAGRVDGAKHELDRPHQPKRIEQR